jgi:hypothetical protein
MTEPIRRPDIRELVGIAVNSSHLKLRPNVETALDRVGALGAATLAVQNGAARADLPIGAMAPDLRRRSIDFRKQMLRPIEPEKDQDILAGELAAVLWHIRYGCQFDAVPKAAALFARWMGNLHRMAGIEPARLEKFAQRVMHEWLSDRCAACAGSRKQERTRAGNWVRPRGAMQRNAIFRPCRACNGSGRSLPCHPERMKLLGLTREQYDAAHWMHLFSAAHAWLGRSIWYLARPLTAELERRKRRPVVS